MFDTSPCNKLANANKMLGKFLISIDWGRIKPLIVRM